MITAALFGAVAGGDRTSYGQTMLAHPVVCGTLAGWVAGDPSSGLRLGIVFGMLAARRAPIGGAGSVIDWTSPSIAVPFALGSAASGWQWGLGLTAGVLFALLGGHLIRLVRAFAAHREESLEAAARAGDLSRIERWHLSFLGLHVVRGAVVSVLVSGLVGRLAFDVRWTGPEQSAAAMIWGFAPLAAAVILLDAHRRHAGWSPVGFGVGAALLLLLMVGLVA
jgi:mannose/fructose/N-acetylgalactosamine-specific phosphotransferase system component IIC